MTKQMTVAIDFPIVWKKIYRRQWQPSTVSSKYLFLCYSYRFGTTWEWCKWQKFYFLGELSFKSIWYSGLQIWFSSLPSVQFLLSTRWKFVSMTSTSLTLTEWVMKVCHDNFIFVVDSNKMRTCMWENKNEGEETFRHDKEKRAERRAGCHVIKIS